MSILQLIRRIPRPAMGRGPARTGARPVCEHRGYCGPFVNQTLYDSLAAWEGFGECVECGRAVPVPRGESAAASWISVGRRLAAAEPPPQPPGRAPDPPVISILPP